MSLFAVYCQKCYTFWLKINLEITFFMLIFALTKKQKNMTKEETLQVINEIIDESAKYMKKEAEQLLNAQSWDFDAFGDRSTFARTAMEVIFDKEKKQYQAINNTKAYKSLKANLDYELSFIHVSQIKDC